MAIQICFIYLLIYLVLERGGGRKRGRETLISCLSYMSQPELNLKPRHMPWPGIEPATFHLRNDAYTTVLYQSWLFSFFWMLCVCICVCVCVCVWEREREREKQKAVTRKMPLFYKKILLYYYFLDFLNCQHRLLLLQLGKKCNLKLFYNINKFTIYI